MCLSYPEPGAMTLEEARRIAPGQTVVMGRTLPNTVIHMYPSLFQEGEPLKVLRADDFGRNVSFLVHTREGPSEIGYGWLRLRH